MIHTKTILVVGSASFFYVLVDCDFFLNRGRSGVATISEGVPVFSRAVKIRTKLAVARNEKNMMTSRKHASRSQMPKTQEMAQITACTY